MNENLNIKVTSDSAQASRDMGGFDSKMKSTIKSVATLAAGMIALKKTYDFLAKSTKMAMEQEAIFRKLQSAVEITGKAWGAASVELDNLFASLQRTTKYGDTESAEVFQRIITLTGDYDKALTGLPIALDLAASGLFDTGTAARYVGMAMTGNIEMLGRYISEFKTTTNEQLKNMTASEKVAYAVDVLREKFGGLAEKELETTAGKIIQLKNYWGDFREAIGDRFLATLGAAAKGLTELFQPSYETKIDNSRMAFERYIYILQNTNRDTELYKETQKKLNSEFGSTLGNLEEQIKKYGSLGSAIKNMREELIQYQVQQMIMGEHNELIKEAAELRKREREIIVEQGKEEAKIILREKKRKEAIEKVNAEYEKLNEWEQKNAAVQMAWKAQLDAIGQDQIYISTKSILLGVELNNVRDNAIEKESEIAQYAEDYVNALDAAKKSALEIILPKLEFETFGIEPDEPEMITVPLKLESFTQEELDQWAIDFESKLEGIEILDLKLIDLPKLEEDLNKIPPLFEDLKGAISGTLYDIFSGEFDNIGEMWVSLLKRMAAEYIVTWAATEIFSKGIKVKEAAEAEILGTAIATSMATAAALSAIATSGGSAIAGGVALGATVALAQGLALAAHGGADFTVPSGYPNDSFPILVESGEHVSVTPSGQRSRTDELLEKVLNAINSKPVANTFIFDDVDMSRYVDRGKLRREYS